MKIPNETRVRGANNDESVLLNKNETHTALLQIGVVENSLEKDINTLSVQTDRLFTLCPRYGIIVKTAEIETFTFLSHGTAWNNS